MTTLTEYGTAVGTAPRCPTARTLWSPKRSFIRDRDTEFTAAFDEISRTEGIRIIRAAVRAPRANAFAKRYVGTVRRELLDRMLIVNRRHLETVIPEFVERYNGHRPHRSLDQRPPLQASVTPGEPGIADL